MDERLLTPLSCLGSLSLIWTAESIMGNWAFAISRRAAVSLREIASTCGHQIGPVCLSARHKTGGHHVHQL